MHRRPLAATPHAPVLVDLVDMWGAVQAVHRPYRGIGARPHVQGMSRAWPVPTLGRCSICARSPALTSALLGVVGLAMDLQQVLP